jgi:hypothetical protein
MTAMRSYKLATTIESARRELADCAGTHFDPMVVRAFLEASLAKRSVIGAPLAALADLSRFSIVQRAGQVATSAGHLTTGVLISTSIGVATVVGVAHVDPHSGPAAAAATAAHVSTAHGATQGPKAPTPTPVPGRSAATKATAPGPHPATTTAAPSPPTGAPAAQSTTSAQPAPAATPTPSASGTVALPTLPGVPTGLSVTGGDGQVTLSWSAPAGDGGSAISGYVVTPFIGGVAQSAVAYASTATVQTIEGLTDGTEYTFAVAATNGVGLGDPSILSVAVTPATGP